MTENKKNNLNSDNFGIGNMSGGTIESGAKIAGIINEGDTYIVIPPDTKPQGKPNNLPIGAKVFVGRESALERLHHQLQTNQKVAITTVTGMGGIGKTELALQYALKYPYEGGICWLRDRQIEANLNPTTEIASQIITFCKVQFNLDLPDNLTLEKQVEYCWRNWHDQGDVLVIFDDVVNYNNIKLYLPQDNRFKVIVTTRLKKLAQAFELLELEVLTETSALELLKSLVGETRINQEIDTAKALCQWLGYLPLGLELVGQYLAKKEDLSLATMQERLEEKKLAQKALKEPTYPTTAQLGVASAFELSWQELTEDAQRLAYFLSLFALAPIPWFSEDEDLEDIRDDELVGRNLLKRIDKNIYQLHQLLREFISQKLETLDLADELKREFCQLMVTINQQIDDTPTLAEINRFKIHVPHLEIATDLLDYTENEDLIWIFTGLARYYKGQGLYNLAEPWFQKCVKVTEMRLGKDHPHCSNFLQ